MKNFVVDANEKYVIFGKYPQENQEPEPIKWRILENKRNSLLLIADKILDCHKFDYLQTDFDNSELKVWLNTYFFDNAFNLEEKQIIIKQNGSYVSLLQEKQALKMNKDDLKRFVTNYAKNQGVHISLFNKGYGWWWLKTQKPALPLEAGVVVDSGNICYHFIRDDSIGIVPVIIVKV
ncbi:MAG: hypothetical protein IJW82_04135 [Clostridia bacterium]|nr:hypothetical protein [Clostridia bacterium]